LLGLNRILFVFIAVLYKMPEKEQLTQLSYLFIGVLCIVFLYEVTTNKSPGSFFLEPFTNNYSLGTTYGDYPTSEIEVLVQDSYPITGTNGVSKEGAYDMWWRYPIFEVGSFNQITNNLRYPNNPDTGKCMPANMCGALYKDIKNKSNMASVLAPVEPSAVGARVNFYRSKEDLLTFRTNEANVLY
jgi:hypothetical protein